MNNPQSDLYTAFDKPPEPVSAFLKSLARAYTLEEPLHVLDIGCGPGRMLREFARMGWTARGLEPDPDFFAEAQDYDLNPGRVDVEQGGFGDLDDEHTYDMVVSINGPFSYLLTVEERVDALERIWRALKPGGVVFLDIANFLWLLKNYSAFRETSVPFGDGAAKRVQHFRIDVHNHVWTQIDEFQYVDPEEGPLSITKTHYCAVITLPEMRYLFRQQGFTDVRTYDSYDSPVPGELTGHDFLISAQRPR